MTGAVSNDKIRGAIIKDSSCTVLYDQSLADIQILLQQLSWVDVYTNTNASFWRRYKPRFVLLEEAS